MSNPLNSLLRTPPPDGPHYRWGYVTSVSPTLQVVLDTETSPIQRPSTLVPLEVGDRVFVLMESLRATVLGKVPEPPPPDDPVPENHIRIGGVDYQASGSFGNITSGSPPAFSGSSPVFYRNLTVARPYAPPTGYGFSVHILSTARVNAIGLLDPTADPLSISQIQVANSNSGTFVVGWQLVKI